MTMLRGMFAGTLRGMFPAAPVAAYSPADTFADVGGAWFYGWDNTDLRVNSDGTGGAVASGGSVGQWQDRSGNGNHVSQATAANRPIFRDARVAFFRQASGVARLANASTDAIHRANFSGGMVIDCPGSADGNIYLSMGADQFDIFTGATGSPEYRYFRIYNGVATQETTLKFRARNCVLTWRSNGSGLIVNVNGVEQTLTALSAASMTSIRLSDFGFGAPHQTIQKEVVIFDEDVGADTIADLRDYLNDQAETSAIDATKTVVIYGDSLCRGWGSQTGKPWSEYVTNRATSVWINYGKDGGSIISPHVTAAQFLEQKGATEGVAVIWSHVNDLPSNSAVTVHNAISAYCATLKAGGMKVVVCNMPGSVGDATFQTKLAALNVLIAANYLTYADAMVDLNTSLPDSSNTTYFDASGVHMKDAGYAVAGGLIQTVMAGLA